MASKKKKSGGREKRTGAAKGGFLLSPSSVRRFYHEVVAEFKKIVWPDRKVTMGLSGFVVLLTAVLSVYLGAVDFILGKLVSMVLQ